MAPKSTLKAQAKAPRLAAGLKENERRLKLLNDDRAKRIDRAAQRMMNRGIKPLPNVTSTCSSPFGLFTLTNRRRGLGGMATTNKENFKGSTDKSKTDFSYKQLLEKADIQTLQQLEIESRKKSRTLFSRYKQTPNTNVKDIDQKRIAAGLWAVERAEEQRHPAAPKGFRAGLRAAIEAAESRRDRAEAFFNAFPQGAPYNLYKSMGKATGARAFTKPNPKSKRIGVGAVRTAESRIGMADVYSDSSGSESS